MSSKRFLTLILLSVFGLSLMCVATSEIEAQPRGKSALDKIRKQREKREAEAEKKADDDSAADEKADAPQNDDDMMETEIGEHVVIRSDINYGAVVPPHRESEDTADADAPEDDGAEPKDAVKKEGESTSDDKEESDASDTADRDHLLDLYLPKDAENFPVVFFVHGGSWVFGEKRHGKAIARGLVDDGYGVVSINYTLCFVDVANDQRSQFPTFVEDAAAAFKWTWDTIAEYGGNRDRIFIAGHSAGGHIATVLASNPKFLKAHELDNQEVIKGQIGISGVYEIEFGNKMMDSVIFGVPFPNDEEQREQASPVKQVREGDAPALLIYAQTELPMIKTWAASYKTALEEHDVPITAKLILKRTHESILREFGTANDEAEKVVLAFLTDRIAELDAADEEAQAESDGDDSKGKEDAQAKPEPAESAK